MRNDDPIYVSEHRRSFALAEEMENIVREGAQVTVIAISAARLNMLEAAVELEARGIAYDLFHLVWLKPLGITEAMLDSLRKTGAGVVIDSDYEIAGAARSIAYELMHRTGARVYALGLEDRVCGVAAHLENITPSPRRIADTIDRVVAGRAA